MTSTPRAQALHDLHTLFGDRIHAYTIPASYPHPPVFVEASFRTPHPSKLAPLGIDACEVLRQQGKRNWLGDIANALQRLHGPIVATLDNFCSTERVNDLVSSVDSMWKDEIVDLITGSPTTSLLATRYQNTHAAPDCFWSYLSIRIPPHRIALTRALTGAYDLAIERGKWVGLARQWRLCGMCAMTM